MSVFTTANLNKIGKIIFTLGSFDSWPTSQFICQPTLVIASQADNWE